VDYEAFFDAAKAAIAAVWPETVPNTIHEAEHEMAIAYATKTLPFASIVTGARNPGKWGVANYTEQFSFSLCYTARWKGTLSSQRAKLNAMERYLRANRVLGTGQLVQAMVTTAYGGEIPANLILERSNMTQRVVAVRSQVVIGEARNAGPE
jgi:hypothetical protein